MADQSELDSRYFVTKDTFNCPYCNRHSVIFQISGAVKFDWNASKEALAVYVDCQGENCEKTSLHLTYQTDLVIKPTYERKLIFADPQKLEKLDDYFFFHQPTSFFTIDERIPKTIRDLLGEADGCRRFNYLTGASACLRKAIYQLLEHEGVPRTEPDGKGGERERYYKDRVQDLKKKREHMDPGSIDILSAALTATSDQLHEDSWTGWTRDQFDAIDEAVRSVLREMYVVPHERKTAQRKASEMLERLSGKGKKA